MLSLAPKAFAAATDCADPAGQAKCSDTDRSSCQSQSGIPAWQHGLCSTEQLASATCDRGSDSDKKNCVAAQQKLISFQCNNTGDQKGFNGCLDNATNAAKNLKCDSLQGDDKTKCQALKDHASSCATKSGQDKATCLQFAGQDCSKLQGDAQTKCKGAQSGKCTTSSGGGSGTNPDGGGGATPTAGGATPTGGGSGSGSGCASEDTGDDSKLACDLAWDAATIFSLRWITCPIINTAVSAAGLFEDEINSLLNIDVAVVFNDNTQTPSGTGASASGTGSPAPGAPTGSGSQENGYHKAWNSFRLIALSIVVVETLVMILAQAAGFELLDAYTIRKVLPRLLFATICIALSWDILEFLVTLSNDAGKGTRAIIYAPFKQLNEGKIVIGGGGAVVTGLIGAGAAIAFGWIGLLAFVGSALIATLVAVATLILREMLIILLVMMAPFAMACYILPNTQKLWDFWRKTFLSLLIVFPIISGFIAIGRVFAITSLNTGGDNTINQLIAIVAYFAPYFMITAAFKLAGGILAQVNGMINKATAPIQGALKQARSNQLKQNWEKARAGERFGLGLKRDASGNIIKSSAWNPFRLGGEAINRAGHEAGAGLTGVGSLAKGNLAEFGRLRGREKQFLSDQAARKLKQDPRFASLANDDDALLAMMLGNTHGDRQDKLTKLLRERAVNDNLAAGGNGQLTASELSAINDRAKGATDRAHSLGYGSGQSRAAFRAAAETGTTFRDQEEQATLAAAASDGDAATKQALGGEANYIAKKVGRHDLAGGGGTIALQAEAISKRNAALRKGDKQEAATQQRQVEAMIEKGMQAANSTMSSTDFARLKAPGYKNMINYAQKSVAKAQKAYSRADNREDQEKALAQGVDAGVMLATAQAGQMYNSGANNATLNSALSGPAVGWLKQHSRASNSGPRGASVPTLYEEAQSRVGSGRGGSVRPDDARPERPE